MVNGDEPADSKRPDSKRPDSKRPDREDQLAAALRANLRRRKGAAAKPAASEGEKKPEDRR